MPDRNILKIFSVQNQVIKEGVPAKESFCGVRKSRHESELAFLFFKKARLKMCLALTLVRMKGLVRSKNDLRRNSENEVERHIIRINPSSSKKINPVIFTGFIYGADEGT